MTRQNVGMRLVLAAASAGSIPRESIGRPIASAAEAPWDSTTVRIDDVDYTGWTLSAGEHRITYTDGPGRTVIVEAAAWPSRVELVSSTDYDLLT